MIIGGAPTSTPLASPNFQVLPEAQSDGAIPQAPGHPVGQTWGKPARHWLGPVRDGRPVKVHCCRQWWVTLNPRGAGGAVKEGERMRAQVRLVREGRGILLEKIRRGYGEMTWR